MKRLLTLASIVVLLLIVTGGQVVAKDTWISVRSRNFVLVGNASEKEIRNVATKLEQFREVYSRLFTKVKLNTTVPTTVVVFKSDKSFGPFKPGKNLAGFFQAGQDVNYIALTTELGGYQDPFQVIFHEYTHLLVQNTVGDAPSWFNEGLAEYYSTFSITDDQKVEIGRPIGNHVFLLRESKMLPLKTLFQVDHRSPYYNERDKQSIFYAQSWALVHYLILGNNGQRLPGINKFIYLTDNNVPIEEAFQQAFEITPEKMEKELREYVKRDRYPIVSGHFQQKLSFDTEMQTAPLGEAEVQAYLGDLLLHSNRAESQGYLEKALTLNPDLAMAQSSLGMLRVRQGKIEEARQNLERAVANNSQNYLIHYYYAFALSRKGMTDSQLVTGYPSETTNRIREELKKSITLRPDFPESYNLLAFVNLVSGIELDESITMLKRVLETSPGRGDVRFMLAQIYLRKEDYKAARQIAERLSRNASEEETRQQAQSMLTQITQMEEQTARVEALRKQRSERSGPSSSPSANASSVEPNVITEPQAAVDPSSYLREALRKPANGETQAQGTLLRIDCNGKQIVFSIKVGERVLKLKTDSFDNIEIVAFTNDAGTEIGCGPRQGQTSVVICYLPTAPGPAKIDGLLKSLDFVPKDFQLKPS